MLFFLISCCFEQIFTSPLDYGNATQRLLLAVPTGIPITNARDVIEMIPLVEGKTIKDLLIESRELMYLLRLLLINSLFLISAIK